MKKLITLGLTALAVAGAQTAPDAIKLGSVTITGTLRTRVYGWDWFEPAGSYQNAYAYAGNVARLNFAAKRGAWDLNVEIAVPLLVNLPDRATAPAPQGALGLGSNYYAGNSGHRNTVMVFPRQIFGRYHFGRKESQTIQAGRFEFNDASEVTPKDATLATLKRDRISQRLIGSFGWSDVGRSFDGLRYSWTRPTTDLTIVAATPTRGVFQTDGWGWNRVAFAYAAFTRQWGHGVHAADTRVFAIDYDDFRDVLKTDNRPAATRRADTENIHVQTWGAHSIHAFKTRSGTVDTLGWAVVQTGNWGSQIHRAYAVDIEAGFQPAVMPRLKPWVRGGYTIGSGDSNAGDGRHESFFQILPTPRPFARFPFFNMMNTEDAYGALILRPHAKVTVTAEAHSLRLINPNDLWYSGGGAYQPWTFGYAGRSGSGRRSLANLYDASLEYRANRHATFTAYLGVAQGKAAIRQIYPANANGRFGYVEVLFRM